MLAMPPSPQGKPAPCAEPPLARMGATCRQVRVPENPAAPSGRTIGLHVITVPAQSTASHADPVFVLVGGPGQGAASLAAGLALEHAALNRDRDLIFMDQRGTGRSRALTCPAAESGVAPLLKSLVDSTVVEACRRHLSGQADLSFYGTPQVVADIETVRQALGLRQLNLHATSYGTRVALEYLRRYPRNVRSTILVGAAPVGMQAPLYYARDAQSAIDALTRDCSADAACAKLGRVNELAEAVLRRAAAGQLRGTVTDPVTGAQHVVTPTRGWTAEVIRHELYSAYTAARLPAALHQAATGDATTLVTRGLARRRMLESQIALGVLLSTTCSEDVRSIDRGVIARVTAGTFLGDSRVRDQIRACSTWPVTPLPAGFGAVGPSSSPVLLVTGANDPVTGPSWAASVAARLENAQHVIVPYAGHGFDGLRNAQCLSVIQTAFVRRPARVTDFAPCLGSIERIPFETSR